MKNVIRAEGKTELSYSIRAIIIINIIEPLLHIIIVDHYCRRFNLNIEFKIHTQASLYVIIIFIIFH